MAAKVEFWRQRDSDWKKYPWHLIINRACNALCSSSVTFSLLRLGRYREKEGWGEEEEREKRGRERDAEKEEEGEEKGQDRSKNKGRKSANEYTQVCSVAVTTRRLIASSHKTAYLMNNTQTHTVESTEHSISPQAIVICMSFQASKTHPKHPLLRTKMARVHMPACVRVSVVKTIK